MIDYTKMTLQAPTVAKPGPIQFQIVKVGHGKLQTTVAERIK